MSKSFKAYMFSYVRLLGIFGITMFFVTLPPLRNTNPGFWGFLYVMGGILIWLLAIIGLISITTTMVRRLRITRQFKNIARMFPGYFD